MIVFCEECSRRNTINEGQVKKGRVTFRCTACGYLNAYPISLKLSSEKDQKEDKGAGNTMAAGFLDRVAGLSGVAGAFLYGSRQGVLMSAMPSRTKSKGMVDLGRRLALQFKLGSRSFSDFSGLSLVWHGRAVIYRPVHGNIALVIIARIFPMGLRSETSLERCIAGLEAVFAGREEHSW